MFLTNFPGFLFTLHWFCCYSSVPFLILLVSAFTLYFVTVFSVFTLQFPVQFCWYSCLHFTVFWSPSPYRPRSIPNRSRVPLSLSGVDGFSYTSLFIFPFTVPLSGWPQTQGGDLNSRSWRDRLSISKKAANEGNR